MDVTNSGFSLIEVCISVAMLALILAAIGTISAQVSSNSTSAQIKNRAVALAEQDIEEVRAYYQANGYIMLQGKINNVGCPCYSDGNLTTCSSTCLDVSSACNLGYQFSSSPPLYQSVTVSNNGGAVEVDSRVGWLDRGICTKTLSTTYFYDY